MRLGDALGKDKSSNTGETPETRKRKLDDLLLYYNPFEQEGPADMSLLEQEHLGVRRQKPTPDEIVPNWQQFPTQSKKPSDNIEFWIKEMAGRPHAKNHLKTMSKITKELVKKNETKCLEDLFNLLKFIKITEKIEKSCPQEHYLKVSTLFSKFSKMHENQRQAFFEFLASSQEAHKRFDIETLVTISTFSIDQLNDNTLKHENNMKKAYADAQAVTSSAEKIQKNMKKIKDEINNS